MIILKPNAAMMYPSGDMRLSFITLAIKSRISPSSENNLLVGWTLSFIFF